MNRDLTEPHRIYAFSGVGARAGKGSIEIGEFHRWRPGSYLLGWGTVLLASLACYALVWRPGASAHGNTFSQIASILVVGSTAVGLIFGTIMMMRWDGLIAVIPRTDHSEEGETLRLQSLHVRTGRCRLRAARTHQFWQLFAVYETAQPGANHEPVYRYLLSAGERLNENSATLRRLREGAGCDVTFESLDETLRMHGTIIALPSTFWKRVVVD